MGTYSLLYCSYFKNQYKMIAVDLSKQQTFDADTKSLRQTNFTGSRTLI